MEAAGEQHELVKGTAANSAAETGTVGSCEEAEPELEDVGLLEKVKAPRRAESRPNEAGNEAFVAALFAPAADAHPRKSAGCAR